MLIAPHLFLFYLISNSSASGPLDHPDELGATCELKYGDGWRGVVRDDDTIMCMKIFTDDETHCFNYSEAAEFCKEKGGFLTPVGNQREQDLLTEFINSTRDLSKSEDDFHSYGVFLGAKKVGDLMAERSEAEFIWEYDGSKIEGFLNFRNDEPNNKRHYEYPEIGEHREQCLEASATKEVGVWYDQSCLLQCRGKKSNVGVVCAKPLTEKEVTSTTTPKPTTTTMSDGFCDLEDW